MDSNLLKPNQVLIRVYLVSTYKKYISIVLYRDSKTQSHLDRVFTIQKEFDYVLMRKNEKMPDTGAWVVSIKPQSQYYEPIQPNQKYPR